MSTRKTPDQVIADLTAKLARAKDAARKQRTRRLIQLGASFDGIAEDWQRLTDDQRATLVRQVTDRVRALLTAQPSNNQ